MTLPHGSRESAVPPGDPAAVPPPGDPSALPPGHPAAAPAGPAAEPSSGVPAAVPPDSARRPEPSDPAALPPGPAAHPDSAASPAPAGEPKRTFTPDFLTELFRNPLDPGYADAAARRARGDGPDGATRYTLRGVMAVTMVLLGFLLVVAYQQTVADAPARSNAQQELAGQVQKRRAATVALQQRADGLRAEVADLRERELSGAAVARLRDLEAAAGLAPVRGSGARITLADGPTPADPLTGERKTEARVKDTDLQLATNALWAAGAEAISVNGQRLTATSTIRQAGEAVLVDFRPVTTPYEVVAIGPDELADDFSDGYAGRFFRQLVTRYGMSFDAVEVDDVTLDAATELDLKVAKPSRPPVTTSPGSSAEPSSPPSEGGR